MDGLHGSVSKFSFHQGIFLVRLLQQVRRPQRGWVVHSCAHPSASAAQTFLSKLTRGSSTVCLVTCRLVLSLLTSDVCSPGLRVCMGCAVFSFSPREDRSPVFRLCSCAPHKGPQTRCVDDSASCVCCLQKPANMPGVAGVCSWNLSKEIPINTKVTQRTRQLVDTCVLN